MANRVPVATSHQGASGGKARAMSQAVEMAQAAWRQVVTTAVQLGIPVPAFATALAYYDGYRSDRLPANLLQAQRDYFGAHTYERTDAPRGKFFHIDWPHPARPQLDA